LRAVRSKVVLAVVMLAAVVRAATGSLPKDVRRSIKPMTTDDAHQAYRDIVSRERNMRREASVKFPGDLWSQDDDFHERESEATRSFATGHEVSIASVAQAIDDGMREHWPGGGLPEATVPPCRPRLSY
jgi:uncharacterized membrane protein